MKKKITLLLIPTSILFGILIIAVGVLSYFYVTDKLEDNQQKHEYLNLAHQCDTKAADAQNKAEGFSQFVSTFNDNAVLKQLLQEQANGLQTLSQDYRNQSVQYLKLAAK